MRIAFGLALALSVAAGCGGPAEVVKDPVAGVSSAPSASPSPTISAAQALTAAARKLNEQTLGIGVTTGGDLVVHGDVDPVAGKARMIVSVLSSRPIVGMELVLTDGVMYAKVAQMPGVPYGWMRLDGKALSGTHLDVLPEKDPAGASQLLAGLVSAERDGSGGFRGTLDLTNVPTAAAYRLKGLGDRAKAVPFTARVNDRGQLTLLDIDLEAVVPGARNIKAQYTDFGQPISVTPPPAAETIDAPADVVARLKA
ncbi:hypothetical protein [Phytohabitans flavus]|uniref:hypothetical protein n=1 Tax=Phytohabitans flavus TaxID=1076124 RepID=UPI001565F544|nr:hypothetical protein [Phytohabitans flavus]